MNVAFRFVTRQVTVSQLQYFLICFEVVCRDYVSLYLPTRQQFPQSLRPSEMLPLHRDVAIFIHGQRGIAYHKRVPVFSYAILRVEKILFMGLGREVRTGHCDKLLTTVFLRIRLDKSASGNIGIIINSIIIVFGVSTFRGLIYLGGRQCGGNRDGIFCGFRLRGVDYFRAI